MTGKHKARPDVPEGMKWCCVCETVAPVAEFRPAAKMRDGLGSYCRECRNVRNRRWRAEHRDETNAKRRIPRSEWKRPAKRVAKYRPLPCDDCGSTTLTAGTRIIRCAACRLKAQREVNRRKNSKRRGTRHQENYTLAGIAKRDGRRCHLCRRKVDMALSGMHRMGPTIDHIIPISAGGDDDPRNVALAHRHCNVERNAGGTAQLRLIA